jgi:hypothetical protein
VSAAATAAPTAAPLTAAQAAAALLTSAQLPPAFKDADPWQHQTGVEGLPSCAQSRTDRTIDVRIPPRVVVGRDWKDSTGKVALYGEEIRVYPDVPTAIAAYNANRIGETCTRGTIFRPDGTTTPIRIDPPIDETAALHADAATEWSDFASFNDRLVIARLGSTLVRFDFDTSPSARIAHLGDPLATAKAGIAKVKAI